MLSDIYVEYMKEYARVIAVGYNLNYRPVSL
jgi:hypothetical protein